MRLEPEEQRLFNKMMLFVVIASALTLILIVYWEVG